MKTSEERRRPNGGEPMQIALLGCGTVGGGVMRLLAHGAQELQARLGVPIQVRHVLVRDEEKPRVPDLDRARLTTDASRVLTDPAVDLYVEVMGGVDFAYECVGRALARGVSVVTANKAMMAAHGPELLALAAQHHAGLAFEAAVGGGIPVIRTLRDALASDEMIEVSGILNGTSNYILSRMTDDGASFDEVLAEAQAKGYAEADPSLDIDGHDAAQKLLVLAMLAFGATPPAEPNAVIVEGIRGLAAFDVKMAGQFGYTIKHLAVGRDRGDTLELRVHPALIRRSEVFANVSGAFNAIRLEGRALGPCTLLGRGAGDMPTAVSVVADILDASRAIVAGVPALVSGVRRLRDRPLTEARSIELRYYLRLSVVDEPGVMAHIAGAMGQEGVSLSQVLQTEGEGGIARVVMITHRAKESAVQAALQALSGKSFLHAPPVLLRIQGDDRGLP